MEGSSNKKIGQWLAVLLTGMLAGSVMLTPVGAHISTFNHLKAKHFYTKKAADARFITPAAADALFLTPAEGDARYAQASSASSQAYAEVRGTTVVSANSKNIAQGNLLNPEPGLFCFSGLSFTPRNAVATFVSLGGVIQTRLANGLTSACTGAQAQVITTNSGGSFANVDFMILLHG